MCVVLRAQCALFWGEQLWQQVKTLRWGQELEAGTSKQLGACVGCLSGGKPVWCRCRALEKDQRWKLRLTCWACPHRHGQMLGNQRHGGPEARWGDGGDR